MNSKGVVIAGTHSGCGKTTVTLGLLAALKRRGIAVAPFKVGPDFIDPGHHRRITGRTSHNLDGWMLPKDYNKALFHEYSKECDIRVIEGVMGLFDGYDGKSEKGSTAEMAKWLHTKVVLVVSVKSMARSVAALIKGFETFDPNLSFAGIIFNHVGSLRHLTYLKEAVEGSTDLPILGALFRNSDIAIPERHLGLVTDEEHPITDDAETALAQMVETGIDLDQLLELANGKDSYLPPPQPILPTGKKGAIIPETVRIGVARDAAFCFYYADNIRFLEQNGAKIIYFSPLKESRLPSDLDGLYFCGGYPEIYAEKLSANQSLLSEIKAASDNNMPIYGECGGFIYLSKTLLVDDNKQFNMAGCFPFEITLQKKLAALGYRQIRLTQDNLLGKKEDVIRGHEFHYSKLTRMGLFENTSYDIEDRKGMKKTAEGYLINATLGSYLHLHFASKPSTATHFVAACLTYKKGNIPYETI